MIPIEISDVELTLFRPKNGHLGFASCIVNDQFYLSDIAIFSRPTGGVRLGFPVKIMTNGKSIDIFKPLNNEVAKQFEDAVSDKLELLLRKANSEIL